MRTLAFLFALGLVGAPFVGCGASAEIGCIDRCGLCSDSEDCCGGRVCSTATSDLDGRCSDGPFSCKLGN
jgi:hypothetical protein